MLPVLDISEYLSDPNSPGGRQFVKALRETCHGPGFFYLIGHGVPYSVNQSIQNVAKEFFDLPLEERNSIAIANSAHFRGYTLLCHERTNGKQDWRDQLDVGPEEPEPILSKTDPIWERLRGPNLWPASIPDMPTSVRAWMDKMHPVGMAIMHAIAEGLEQDRHIFDNRMTPSPYTRVKIIRYPAQSDANSSGQGLGLHNDTGIITLILQDDIPGLQVLSEGKLIDVTPMSGAFVVNLGEMLQAASNGYLRATKHQVVSPPVGKQRISIAYFMNPRLDAVFDPVQLPESLANQATGIQDSNQDNKIFTQFGVNTLKTRLRAHPDVAAAHYADLDSKDIN